MKKEPLILVSSSINPGKQIRLEQDATAPRQDYLEIARRLDGKLYGYDVSTAGWYNHVRQIERRLKLDFVESFLATHHLSRHSIVLSMSEKNALPMALRLRMTGQKLPHVVIAHKLSSGYKTKVFKTLNLHETFSHVICLAQPQVDYAVRQLDLSPANVDFVYDKVDHHFFRPLPAERGSYILAVGQEQRDYTTLARAIAGTGLKLIVVASSPWSTHQLPTDEVRTATVLSRIPYRELRDLYAGARLVVVPLYDVDYAAGVNAALEAMAMGKALIASRSRGLAGYITDSETGLYVPPGAPEALREAILSLWEQPRSLERLETNARQAVVERMNMDIYVERVTQIVEKVLATSPPVTAG